MEDLKLEQFQEEGIQYVRMVFVDTSNIVRFRIIPISRFLGFINRTSVRGVFMSNAAMGLLAHQDHIALEVPAAISVRGEICLVPDVTSGVVFKRLAYGSGTHSLCMVDLEEKDSLGVAFAGCPRSSLKNILQSATNEFALSFLVGFETEVTFLENYKDSITPIDNTTYCSSAALHSEKTSKMMDEIAEAIVAQGIGISQFHAESGPGQFEFSTDPYDPLTAADNLVRTRETIYNIAARHNIKATVAPKVFTDSAGSGCHCHISIQGSPNAGSPGPNAPEGLSALEENFMAGVLRHLRAICAFTLPNVNSYDRTKENCWAGSCVSWGIDNREATVRLAYIPEVNRKFNLEIKCVDGTANPYLVVGACIVAGLDGIRKDLKLTIKELTGALNELSNEERLKIKELPGSIEEALEILEGPEEYDLFCKGMGKTLVDIFIAVRKGETEYMRKMSKEDQLKFVIKTY